MTPITLGVLLAVALPSAAASAQQLSAAAAKAGEIPLRITARGEVAADAAVLLATVAAGGTDRAQTEAKLHKEEQAIIAALGGIGISSAQVVVSTAKIEESERMIAPQNRFGFAEALEETAPTQVNLAIEVEQAAADAAAEAVYAAAEAASEAANPPRKPKGKPKMVKTWAASSILTITVTKLEQLPEAMRLAGVSRYGSKPVQFVFNDEAAAQRKAIERALASARSEANAHAAAMNYRVVRISGLSNTEPPISISDGMRAIGRFSGRGRELEMLAIRTATVNVDYVIAPN